MSSVSFMDDHIVAHHEAAHAVLALEAGLDILDQGIAIANVAKTGGLGSDGCRLFVADLTDVPAGDLRDEQARLVGQIDRSGTVLAAGPASDAKLLGEDPWLALQRQRSDFAAMRNLLRRARFIDEDEVDGERLRAQVDLAVEALGDPDIWKAVEAVAQRTLENGGCLSGKAIEKIAGPILDPSRRRWVAGGRRR